MHHRHAVREFLAGVIFAGDHKGESSEEEAMPKGRFFRDPLRRLRRKQMIDRKRGR